MNERVPYKHPDGMPPVGQIDRTGEEKPVDIRPEYARPTVANAVKSLRERMPGVRPNGIFKHPPDWTDEEIAFIADCLKKNIPLYTIANMVHCEKTTLSLLIRRHPDLSRLSREKYENLVDEAEYQVDRLMKGGNASLVMYVLQTLGRKRGWSTEDGRGDGGASEGRIVMGEIPEAEVEKAEADRKALVGGVSEVPVVGNGLGVPNPMQMAAVEDAVRAEVDRRQNVVEVGGEAGAAPYGETVETAEADAEGVEDGVSEGGGEEVRDGGYGGMAYGGGYGGSDDPWSSGADSPFFQ